jgi:cytochrome P450
VLATADDPRHAHERKLVLPALVAKRIRAQEPAVAAAAQRLWRNAQRDKDVDWMAAIGDQLPMTVVANIIGLPNTDVPRLVEWAYASTELLGGVLSDERLLAVVDATVQLAAYLHTAFDRARVAPADDLLGDLVRAADAGDLDENVAILMLVQLVGAGGESTAGLIGNAARLLADDPDLQHTVRTDPSLIPALLEETLRLESPFRGHHRHVRIDTTLAGVALPADSHLLLMWGAANRDPNAFDDPDQVRLNRSSPRNHFAFGRGLHFCVGAALARLEARIAIHTLLSSTRWFDLAGAEWVPSIMVRRHKSLRLRVS